MIASTTLVAALSLTSSPPESQPEPLQVAVQVDVSTLPATDITEEIHRDLLARQRAILEEGGVVVVDDASTKLRVTVSRYGDGDVNYRFVVALFQDGRDKPTVERTGTCDLCLETEMYERVATEVARVSGVLVIELPEAEADDGPAPGQAQHESEPGPDEPQPEPTVRRVGGAGWAGIGLAVAGLGATVGGVIVLATPDKDVVVTGDDFSTDRTEYSRPAGGAALGLGVGGLLVGTALIVVDQTILLDRRRQRARPTSLVPFHMRSGLGLTWTVRF